MIARVTQVKTRVLVHVIKLEYGVLSVQKE